jgi:hypothetical protein
MRHVGLQPRLTLALRLNRGEGREVSKSVNFNGPITNEHRDILGIANDEWSPLTDATKNEANEVAEVFERVIVAEDAAQKREAFWTIWKDTQRSLFAVADWQERLKHERSDLGKLASVLLLDLITPLAPAVQAGLSES